MKAVLLGFVLAIAIIAVGHFYYHIPQGPKRLKLFGVAAGTFTACSVGGYLYGRAKP